MYRMAAALAILVTASAAAMAAPPKDPAKQKNSVIEERGKTHFEAPLPANTPLRLHIRSGDIHIVGADTDKITVDVSSRHQEDLDDVKYKLTTSGSSAEFRVSGGPRNDMDITVRIPRNSNLFVRIPAGDVTIEEVVGDKDVELHAGDLKIHVGKAEDYSTVEASVSAGDIDAAPFQHTHSGLFRSFKHDGPGKFSLHAHVGAGDLTLL